MSLFGMYYFYFQAMRYRSSPFSIYKSKDKNVNNILEVKKKGVQPRTNNTILRSIEDGHECLLLPAHLAYERRIYS